MTFKELLNSVTFDEVAPCLLQMHPDAEGNLKWYKIHFDMLRQMTPKHHDDANSDVCNITMEKWRDGKMILDAHPMEGDLCAYSGDTRSPIPVISVHLVGNLQYRRQS